PAAGSASCRSPPSCTRGRPALLWRCSRKPGVESGRRTPRPQSLTTSTRLLGKLCTGDRAEAAGWLSHEFAPVETGVGLVIAPRVARGIEAVRPSGLTGRTSPLAATTGGGPGRG